MTCEQRHKFHNGHSKCVNFVLKRFQTGKKYEKGYNVK